MNAPLEIRNQIDGLCDAFDRCWSGHSPDLISNLLDEIPAEHRAELLRELIQIDQERCVSSGTTVPARNYQIEFPEYVHAIEQLIAETESADLQDDDTRTYIAGTTRPPDVKFVTEQRVGSYRLEERIGEGGMGVVYKAVHEELGRPVALKILAIPLTEAIPRFQVEARTIAGLNHPHIVQIYETGEYQQRPFLALELMHGSLDDLLHEELPSPRRAAEIVRQIADAVAAAHEIGVIHRDLKPANVLLNVNGCAKLADFGLARDLNVEGQTMSGTLLGTPGFMAPEQTTGGEPDPAIDIYGLGAILYATLTGRPPFRGANIPDTLTMVREREPVSVRALVPSVPLDLESVCMKCLQKNPTARYASAADLADELQEFIAGRPVQARPPGRLEKFARWCLRNPMIAALSGVIALVVALGIGGVFIQWRRAEANAQRFEQAAALAKQEAETTDAVNQFMREVLGAAQASRLGRDATVREAMDEAATRINEAFADRPRVEAAVRLSLGETFRSLGEAGRSIQQFRAALRICRKEYGNADEHTLDVMDLLAGTLRSIGDSGDDLYEAAALREVVMAERVKTLGDTHPQTLRAFNNLATVYSDLGDLDRAQELYERAIAFTGHHPDSDLGDATATRFNLATIHRDRGDLERAEREVREVVQVMKGEVGYFEDAEIEILNAQNTLAGILHRRNKQQEAESIYRQVLTERQALLGRDHQHTLSTHRRLTRLLVEVGAFQDALPLLDDCLEIHNKKFGEGAGLTFGVRKSITAALIGLNRHDEARTFLEETVGVLAETRGAGHRYTQEAENILENLTRQAKQ